MLLHFPQGERWWISRELRVRAVGFATLVLVAALSLTACGASSSSSSGGNATSPVAAPSSSSSGNTSATLTLSSTCGQYLAANQASQAAFFQSIMTELAIQMNASALASDMVGMCQSGPSSDTLNQVLVNSGDLGPGQ